MSQPLKLRWVLAHVPYDLFLRAANHFAKTVEERTNGAIQVEVMGKPEWEKEYNNGEAINIFKLLRKLAEGEFEMSQMYSTVLGQVNNDWYALDMPFLFKDHDHATRVLDGNIGEYLLKGLGRTSNLRGLAFTYSGGYKMIASNKAIGSVEDLKGMHVRCGHSPVSKATFESLGATTEAMGVDGFVDAMNNNQVDGGENVFPRYFRSNVDKVTNSVSLTDHAMFLTSIIINKDIWNSLTEEQQTILQECAYKAAEEERKQSLIDGADALQRARNEGIEVVEWNEDELNRFKDIVEPIHGQFNELFFDKQLVNRIKKA